MAKSGRLCHSGFMRYARFHWLLVFRGLMFIAFTVCCSIQAEPLLHTAAEVLAISPQQARAHQEVRLIGVITFAWHADMTEFTLQDASGAVWLAPILLPSDCTVGTKVEIEGQTEMGSFSPIVRAEAVRSLGHGILPVPYSATYEDLLDGQFQYQRVEITGIVRRQRVNPEFGLGWLALEIVTGGGRLTVNVTHVITGHPELVDARVRVVGVNLHLSDSRQQAFLPMINADTIADVEILTPANPHPFAQPLVMLNQIMRSINPATAGHRVHVLGTVTAVRQTGSFFLQDQTRGLQVFPSGIPSPKVGEIVDVIGFPEAGAFSPILRDADWRPVRSNGSVTALAVSGAKALQHDGRLITVQGQLIALAKANDEIVLTLKDRSIHFHAYVPDARLGLWRVGSKLQVTGVCSAEVGDWESLVIHRQPQGFSLLVGGVTDITLLHAAPLWTSKRVAWVLMVLGAALVVAFGVVWTRTRRHLREVMHNREAANLQFNAIIGERNRMAREIHDTLAQGFAGISVQLEVLNDRLGILPVDIRHHLNLARNLVRSSLDEARRTVWNLRSQILEENGLPGALNHLGLQITDGSGLTFKLHIEGVVRGLPVDVENNLLHIGQEVITNVVRHSGARRMTLTLIFQADYVRLSMNDDGHGFDPSSLHTSRFGGFGLAGIKERAEVMHAQLEVHSAPDCGTFIQITIPNA